MEDREMAGGQPGLGGQRRDGYHWAPAGYEAPRKISLALTQDHILTQDPSITGRSQRKTKAPPRFSQGERDICMTDEYRINKRPRESPAVVSGHDRGTGTVSVVIPTSDGQYESDVSSLTDLDDMPDPFADVNDDVPVIDQSPLSSAKQPEGGNCTERISILEKKLQEMQRENAVLKEQVSQLTDKHTASHRDNAAARCISISPPLADLHARAEEVKSLRRRLSRTLEMVELTRPLSEWDAVVESTGFIHSQMHTLSNYVAYVADSLHSIQEANGPVEVLTTDRELASLVDRTIASGSLLASDPVSAFRALAFGFLREHVFEAQERWRSLHCDSIMLAQYQQIIEQTISPDAVEKYHRAAVRLLIANSPDFKEIFVANYVEALYTKFMAMLTPFICKSQGVGTQLQRQLRTMLRHAIHLRAACYPARRIRYELVQFAPGSVYDPQSMQAEDEVGRSITIPDDGRTTRFVKVCVHGLIRAHSISETASGRKLVEALSCPFLAATGPAEGGRMVSGKATVILK
ncbi:hypothetical protein BJY01DRAFT_254359 [Aspergillus pseudoustus]|uniref:Uncharacterized protein n=1 Tax=Aspergillus pseudoustus TaxID=1810923 RepID=A0ABR4IVJ7_9EURO